MTIDDDLIRRNEMLLMSMARHREQLKQDAIVVHRSKYREYYEEFRSWVYAAHEANPNIQVTFDADRFRLLITDRGEAT
jgi:hypothetical protein